MIAIENLTSVFHKIRKIFKSVKSEESCAYEIIFVPGQLRDFEKRAILSYLLDMFVLTNTCI